MTIDWSPPKKRNSDSLFPVIRCILVGQNKRLDREEQDMQKGAQRERIEEAARLEGITFEEALQRKRGFRYLI